MKFGVVVLFGLLLGVPFFSVHLLINDRESQSKRAQSSMAEGQGEPQQLAGPLFARRFSQLVQTKITENGH